jgi:2-phosphoglycerate kinase
MHLSSPNHVTYIVGASGTGTSTRAEQLRRELTAGPDARGCCVIATDVVRAQLRAVLHEHDHPDLWGESFNLDGRDGDRHRDGVNVDAFERQCAPILRAVEAGVEYALSEGWDVIVEGVHLLPGAFGIPTGVPVTVELLVVTDAAEHVARFRSRDAASGGRRPAAHYEANLARVHAVQDELVDRWLAWRAALPTGVELTLIGPDA